MVDEEAFLALLSGLERAWGRLYAPAVEYLRPGLQEDQIEAIMAPTGLTLPVELRMWWSWHDGADGPDEVNPWEVGPGGWLHLPLREAVSLYEFHQRDYAKYGAIGASDLAELAWRPGLFPFTHRAAKPTHVLAADTRVGAHASAPVAMTTEMGIEDEAGAGSVSDIVSMWLELLDSGRYHWEAGTWSPIGWQDGDDPDSRWFR